MTTGAASFALAWPGDTLQRTRSESVRKFQSAPPRGTARELASFPVRKYRARADAASGSSACRYCRRRNRTLPEAVPRTLARNRPCSVRKLTETPFSAQSPSRNGLTETWPPATCRAPGPLAGPVEAARMKLRSAWASWRSIRSLFQPSSFKSVGAMARNPWAHISPCSYPIRRNAAFNAMFDMQRPFVRLQGKR